MPTLADRLEGFEWLDWVVEKINRKHNVELEEVEQCFYKTTYKLRRVEDNKYQFLSRTDSGRYLAIIFAWNYRYVRVITARDMTKKERDFYSRK
ncbi:MAG: BrnT family toxin [Chloroflexota bacterium]|nr:BrnT family toxin [Chloroflexota bacterium]